MSEPFVGEHWGSGYDEEIKDGWTDSDTDDGDDEEILTPSAKNFHLRRQIEGQSGHTDEYDDGQDRMNTAREVLRAGTKGAYWKNEGLGILPVKEGLQGWRKVSTVTSALSLGLSMQSISSRVSTHKVGTSRSEIQTGS